MLWFKQQLKQTPNWAGWFSWYWVLRDCATLIGLGGFKGAPNAAGAVELGYSVLPAYQGQGYATEAAAALIAWAFSHAAVNRVVAEVSPAHVASIRVLEKNGFTRGEVHSPKGSLRFALERSAWSGAVSAGPGQD